MTDMDHPLTIRRAHEILTNWAERTARTIATWKDDFPITTTRVKVDGP